MHTLVVTMPAYLGNRMVRPHLDALTVAASLAVNAAWLGARHLRRSHEG